MIVFFLNIIHVADDLAERLFFLFQTFILKIRTAHEVHSSFLLYSDEILHISYI